MISILLFIWSLQISAQEKSAFERSMEQDTAVSSVESWMEIKGAKYRKYELTSGVYYIKFKNPETPVVDLYCTPPEGYKSERLVIEQPTRAQRSRAFVQVLHEKCQTAAKGAKSVALPLDPKIGLAFPEEKKSID